MQFVAFVRCRWPTCYWRVFIRYFAGESNRPTMADQYQIILDVKLDLKERKQELWQLRVSVLHSDDSETNLIEDHFIINFFLFVCILYFRIGWIVWWTSKPSNVFHAIWKSVFTMKMTSVWIIRFLLFVLIYLASNWRMLLRAPKIIHTVYSGKIIGRSARCFLPSKSARIILITWIGWRIVSIRWRNIAKVWRGQEILSTAQIN